MSTFTDQELLQEIQLRFDEKNASIKEMEFMTKKLLELNEKLTHADKEKDTFLSLIKNELNNPIFSVLNLCSTMGKRLPDEFLPLIDMMSLELLKLDFQVKNIITASEIEAGKIANYYSLTDLEIIINESIESLRFAIHDKYLRIETHLHTQPFVSDPSKVSLIITNLLSNAVKFADENSTISISTYQKENFIYCDVKNYGLPIDLEHHNSVFNRFVKVGPFHDGLGLGLSVVRGLVESLDGHIDFTSNHDLRETIFTMTLLAMSHEVCQGQSMGGNDIMFDDFEDTSEF